MTSADALEPAQQPVTIVIAADERRADISFEGDTQVVTGTMPKETRREALDVVTRHALGKGRPLLVNARDANGEWQLVVHPDGVVHAGGERGPAGGPMQGRTRRAVRVAGIGALVVGLLAVVGGVGIWLLYDTEGDGGGVDDSVPFEARPAPPGYDTQADWHVPMDPESQPSVSPEGDRVSYVNQDGQLVVAGPDGSREWADELPTDVADIENHQFVRHGDGYGVAIAAGNVLWQWPEGGGEPVSYEVSSDLAITFAGSSALVGDDENAFVPVDGELQEVPVQAPAGPLVADGDRVLMAELHAVPWTWVTPDESVSEVAPETPPEATAVEEVLTARADHVLVLWSTGSDDVVLAVHDSDDGSVMASQAVPPDAPDDAQWNDGDTVGAYGPVLFNLANGNTEVVDGFEPVSASGDTVYGERDGGPVALGPDGEAVDLEQETARPWGLLDGRAIVVAESHIYALSPQ